MAGKQKDAKDEAGGGPDADVNAIADPAIRAEEISMREADAALLVAMDESPKSQSEKFVEKARELGLGDVDQAAAEDLEDRQTKPPQESIEPATPRPTGSK